MKYYIAADGGGSKTEVVLYDEKLKIIGCSKVKGTNFIYRDRDELRNIFRECFNGLIPSNITRIDSADICIMKNEDVFLEELGKRCEVGSVSTYTESSVLLASAGLEYGIVAQSGTGSAVMMVRPDVFSIKGGLGFLIGDEGSGFDIGSRSIRAAVNAEEGHGAFTLMLEYIKKEYNLNSMRRMAERLYTSDDPVAEVASVSRITGSAAKAGDEAAIAILENAAHEMALRVVKCMKESRDLRQPVVAAGGAWKGNDMMFNFFKKEILGIFPEADVRAAELKPVAGCIIRRKMNENEFSVELMEKLKWI